MAWSFSTEAILDELRTAAGANATDGTNTWPWVSKPEGPILRRLEETSDYPLLIFSPGATEGTNHVTRHQLDLPVTVTAVVKASRVTASGSPTAKMYEMARLVGENMVSTIMNTGHKLNGTLVSDRWLRSAGVDHETIEDIYEDGLLAYSAEFVLTYYELEP